MKMHRDPVGWEIRRDRIPTKKELQEQDNKEFKAAVTWAVSILGTAATLVLVNLI